MLFFSLVFVLAVICQTYAYTVPTLNCSGIHNLGGIIDDTLTTGAELFYTKEKLSLSAKCPSGVILKITNKTDGTNGTIVALKQSLESYCNENIQCEFDCKSGSQTNTQLVIFAPILRTLNYNLSFIEPQHYTANVHENVENGTAVKLNTTLGVKLENCIGGPMFPTYSARYKLSKKENNTGPFFWAAETSNNSLHVNGLINFEKEQTYEVAVEVRFVDTANKPLNGTGIATATITVSVDDVDDNNPRFNISQEQMYKLWIPEHNSSYVNTSLPTTPPVHAYDPDFGINMSISYSVLDHQKAGLFRIDNESGEISVVQELDYENQKSYTVYIKASQTDKPDTATAQAIIEVNVIDIDDHLPEFNPNNYSCSVGEHSVVGTVVCSLTAIDKDETSENSNFTYILWDYKSLLSVNNEGRITVGNSTAFDRETTDGKITFKVGTRIQNGTYGGNATVIINLIDINDNNPEFQPDKYSFILNTTNGSFVGQVNATDRDEGQNAEITYTISPSVTSLECVGNLHHSKLFSIDSSTGEITIASNEVTFCKQYVLSIQACDNGINRRCSLTVVDISRSTSPDLTPIPQHVSVLEELPAGTAVDIVECNGINHRYTQDDGPEFYIDNSTGMLKTMKVLDRETKDSYNFTVNVTNDSNMLLCIVRISVSVEDANDNAPHFVNTQYNFTLPPNPKDGDFLGTVVAEDEDLGDNGNVSYFLEIQSNSPFALDEYTGNLTISQAQLLNEDIMQVFVTAADNGTPKRKQSTTFYIIGQTSGNTVPISTPLPSEQVFGRKQELARNITRILNIPVEISLVEEVQNKTSQYKSRIHITAAQNSTTSTQHFLSQVLAHYEDIRSLFYQSSENTGETSHSKSAIGPSEIGLIVMAGVILAGAIIAIVIVHRQFNSHKRYKQLYETLTKNSSLYESQEIRVDIGDDLQDCNGTVQSQDINDEDAPSLTVSAVNPVYQSESALSSSNHLTQSGEDNCDGSQNENTDVKEVLQRLSDSYEQEENVSEKLNDQNDKEHGPTSETVVYAHVVNTADKKGNSGYENVDIVFDETEKPPVLEEGTSTNSSKNNDLITFDSDSNGEASGEMNNEPENEREEEPQPDYNEKQVRFHSEVLDADENKLQPLKVKNEEEITEGNTAVDEAVDEDECSGDTPVIEPDTGMNDSAGDIGPVTVKEDTEKLEEEIDSPEVSVPYTEQIQDEFYYGAIQSTQF